MKKPHKPNKPYASAAGASGQTTRIQETAESIMEVGAFNAKTHLSEILTKVSQGATFYVTKHGKRIAEIRPMAATPPKTRNLGKWRGQIWMAPDFDAPLDDFKGYME